MTAQTFTVEASAFPLIASDEPQPVALVSVEQRLYKHGPRLTWRFSGPEGGVLTQHTRPVFTGRTNAGKIAAALLGKPLTAGQAIALSSLRRRKARAMVEADTKKGFVRIAAIGPENGSAPLTALDHVWKGGVA